MRNMTDAAAAQTVARQIRCVLFAELHFLSSIERVWWLRPARLERL